MTTVAESGTTADEFRGELRAWLDRNDLSPGPDHSLPAHIEQMSRVRRALYDAGWMRYGWPEEVGGNRSVGARGVLVGYGAVIDAV